VPDPAALRGAGIGEDQAGGRAAAPPSVTQRRRGERRRFTAPAPRAPRSPRPFGTAAAAGEVQCKNKLNRIKRPGHLGTGGGGKRDAAGAGALSARGGGRGTWWSMGWGPSAAPGQCPEPRGAPRAGQGPGA